VAAESIVRLLPADTDPPDPAEALHDRPEAGNPTSLAAAVEPLPDRSDRWLIDVGELAHLTSLSVRHLRRLDSSCDIPGRVKHGKRVLFQTEIIREWVRAGLPDRDKWAALQRQKGKR
jgi:hypothetical protein